MAFLDKLSQLTFANEAEVETRFVEPLLELLGYDRNDDIRPKYPVVFQEGRTGRRPEADFVVFAGPEHSKTTSILVVEAKAPGEPLPAGKAQGESYAANQRAPFLMLTNGKDFELWQLQISYESERVFSSSLTDLASRFDEIHRLISKAAATHYVKSLRQKDIADHADNFQDYIASEKSRTQPYTKSIPRRLSLMGSSAPGHKSSDNLLNEFPNGAVIVASSGYGKTTLANTLCLRSAEAAASNHSSILPFYIALADLAASNQKLFDYACERLSAHCPQVSTPAFRYLLRSVGAVIVLDGFDRLGISKQAEVLAEINALRRDYSLVKLFVSSRAQSRPDIPLPLLELSGFSLEEQVAYMDMVAAERGEASRAPASLLPDSLRALCAVPILLELALRHWYDHHSFPGDLKVLFRSWLDRLLRTPDTPPSRVIFRENALRVIASESDHGALTGQKAIEALRANALDTTLLDDLIQCDAIRIAGSSIELVHEAIGDYLRADRLATTEPESFIVHFAAIPLESGSLFPVLLASTLRRHDLQQLWFRRLATADLRTYFDALRYRADLSSEVLDTSLEVFADIYLTDLLDGINEPLEAFFPQLAAEVYASLASEAATAIAIRGQGNADWMSYCFTCSSNSEARVVVGALPSDGQLRGSNLRLLGLRADSGRMLGLSQLKEELHRLPKLRMLKGGIEWTSERLIGRLRFLIDYLNLPFDLHAPLDFFEAQFRPHAHSIVAPGLGSDIQFTIAELLGDLALLRERGDEHLNLWWEESGAVGDLTADETKTAQLFNTFYKRLQIIYKEVIEHSFPNVSAEFGFYTSMPVRWDLVLRAPPPDRYLPTIHERWRPVETWDQAGADLEILEVLPDRFTDYEFAFAPVQEELRKFGRLTEKSHIWTGGGITPRFDGNSIYGGYTGETPVLVEVCNYIEDDLKRLFATAPGGDIPYPERYLMQSRKP